MLARVALRSASVRTRKRWSTPTPRSKPSSTTYATIITATNQNQIKPIMAKFLSLQACKGERQSLFGVSRFGGNGLGIRAVADFAVDEDGEEEAQQGVEAHEAKQCKQAVAGRNGIRVAFAGAHKAIDEPRLAAEFGGHPAGGVGNVRQRKAEQQRPQSPARRVEPLAPEQKCGDDHQQCKPGSEAGHDVVGVKEQRQGGGPLVAGNLVEAFYLGLGGSVDEEAERVVDDDGVVDLLCHLVGLANQHESRSGLAVKEAFHAGGSDRLVVRDELSMQVAGGKDDEDRRNNSGDDADLEKDAGVLLALSFQEIEGARGGHDKGTGNNRAGHVVRVLEQPPGVEQQLPEAEHLELPVGQAIIGHRMLHPGVGDDDEKTRNQERKR